MTTQLDKYVKEFLWLTNYSKENVINGGFDLFMDNVAQFFNCDSIDDLYDKPMTIHYLLNFLFNLLNKDYDTAVEEFMVDLLNDISEEFIICQGCGWLFPAKDMIDYGTGNWLDDRCEGCWLEERDQNHD